jgi:hypothetical protein
MGGASLPDAQARDLFNLQISTAIRAASRSPDIATSQV